jgi:uncharacterized integral membrane protein
MLKLIIHILLLAVVVVFVALNVSYSTSINLFGYMFEEVSTVAVVLVSFIVGIIYSFFYYVLNYFYKSGRKKDRERRKKTKDMEKELNVKSEQIQSGQTASNQIEAPGEKKDPRIPPSQETEEAAVSPRKDKKKLFSRSTSKNKG